MNWIDMLLTDAGGRAACRPELAPRRRLACSQGVRGAVLKDNAAPAAGGALEAAAQHSADSQKGWWPWG